MTNRKKRLQKGIESLDKQIKLHEDKLKKAEEDDNIELANYYKKEIESKKKDIANSTLRITNVEFAGLKILTNMNNCEIFNKEEKQRMLNKGG